MNYFNQLLESYSRLKKRNLVLLEADKKPAKKSGEKSGKAKANEKAQEIDNSEALKLLQADFNGADQSRDEANESARASEGAPYYWKAQVTHKAIKRGLWNGEGEPPVVVKVFFKEQISMGTDVDQLKHFYPKNYQSLINYYMEGASDNIVASLGGANLAAIQNIPGNKLRDKVMELAGDGAEDMTEAITRIQVSMTKLQTQARGIADIARKAGEKKYFAGWVVHPEKRAKKSGEVLKAGSEGYTSPNAIDTFITGDSGQSISRILREGATARLDPDVGLDFTEIARDPDFIARGLESITALTTLASPTTPPDVQAKCLELAGKVMRKGKQLVFLTGPGTDGNAEGLVMPENEFLSYAVKRVEKRCKREIQEVPRAYNANELNAVRGPAFETGIVGASVFGGLTGEKDELLKEAVYSDLVDWMHKELNKDSRKFTASMVKLRRFRNLEAAEDVQGADLAELFEDFDRLTNTPAKFKAFFELVSKLREVQTKAMDIGADMAFPVAKEKGVGYSDDVVDLFRDQGKAQKGMKKLGLEGTPGGITIGELRKKDKTLTAIFEKIHFPGGVGADTVIYKLGEGVKAYMNPTEVKVGESGRLERRSDVIMKAGVIPKAGTKKTTYLDKDGAARKKKKDDTEEYYDGKTSYLLEEYNPGTAEVVWERLWGKNKSDQQAGLKSAQRYQQDVLDHTKITIDSLLPSDMTVVMDDDDNTVELNYDTFHQVMATRIADLAFDDRTSQTLKTILQNGEINKNLKDKTTRLKAREELNRLLINIQQYSDMSYDGTDPEKILSREDAKNNLAYSVQMFGGVKHDSTITSMGLDKKSILVTSHMKTINKYTQGLLSGVIDFKLGGEGFSLKLVDRENPKRNLSQRTMRSGMTQATANTETDIILSNDALEEFAVVNEILPAASDREDGGLMVDYLKGQHALLEKLLATQ